MPEIIGRGTKTSTNDYASVFDAPILTKTRIQPNFVIQYFENNVNAVTIKVRGSNDGTHWIDLGDDGSEEIAVLKNGSDYQTLYEAWQYLDVQVKSTVAATHGSITVIVTQG